MKTKQGWFEAVLSALASLSRTFNGVSDTTSAAEKPKLAVEEGDTLKAKSSQNLGHALEYLWTNRLTSFASPASVREFIDALATIVSEGLLQPGQSFYRTWATKFGHTLPENIEREYQSFCEWFFNNVDSDDPVAVAALVEKRLDGKIHPFADGCGRTSKLLAAFTLLRHDIFPPSYGSRNEYYVNINLSDAEWISYYRSLATRKGEKV